MRAALYAIAVVAVVTLSVSRCAGRPWHRQRQQRSRLSRPAVHRLSATSVAYEDYDGPSVSPSDQGTRSRQAEQPEPDYGEPERVYAEPERVYAEPERVYAEPERVYAEPERVYADPERVYGEPERVYGEPEQNYEVDEATSVLSEGRVHGVQQPRREQEQEEEERRTEVGSVKSSTAASSSSSSSSSTITTTTSSTTPAAETRKSGYVVDGKHYRKYRVEEETPDGFIVGEYGVVSHRDGTTRGVRYTADSSINPRVIYEALAKFLALRR